MSLNTKYRPKLFKDVYGSVSTIASLKAIFKRNQEDIPHSFLLTGPSGCGKTTLARIIAKKLKCSKFDFMEMDSADFRGIDTIRDIRKQMFYLPTQGECRVWILDECHQLTGDAQQALLKALENTPAHTYFILATTDPEKLKITLRRRCVEFEIQSLSDKEMKEWMDKVQTQIKTKLPEKIVELIMEQSLGSPGRALTRLDKVIDLDKADMEDALEQIIEQEKGTIELCRALIKGERWGGIKVILKGLTDEPESIRRAVLGYCNSVLLNSGQENAYIIMEAFREPLYNTGRPGLTMACYEASVEVK